MIRFPCSFDSSIGRFRLEDYVRELEVAVFSFDDLGQQFIVGRIAATQVLWAAAEIDDEPLFDVCDMPCRQAWHPVAHEAASSRLWQRRLRAAIRRPRRVADRRLAR